MAADHPIPDAALQQHIAILGKTGAGKTVTVKGIVEHVVAEGARVCILDPIKSDYWGLTSSEGGDKPGLPFCILGGPHGHLSLDPDDGAALGEIVAQGDLPLSILDMADFKAGGLQDFFCGFAPALLKHMQGVVYLVIDEAHEFAPKERAGFGGENMTLHFAKKLATAGRSRGIRLVVATQRVQSLHNALLGSCDTLIGMRLTAPADQKPIVDWLKANVPKDVEREVAGSLASLRTGTGWVCSGEAKVFERMTFPMIHTFDNSVTPTADSRRREVASAAVDIERLRVLLGNAGATFATSNEGEKIDMAPRHASPAELAAAEKGGYERGYADGLPAGRASVFAEIDNMMVDFHKAVHYATAHWRAQWSAALERGPGTAEAAVIAPALPAAVQKAVEARPRQHANGEAKALGAERRPLAVLVGFYPSGTTEATWATLAGLKRKGGTWSTYLSRLRVAGRVEKRDELWFATDRGVEDIGDKLFRLPAPGPELIEFWAAKLPGAGPMLRTLASVEGWVSRDWLATNLNMAVKGGTFGTYLSRLRAPGLIEESGMTLRINPEIAGRAA